jgi:type III pantothenate kinase
MILCFDIGNSAIKAGLFKGVTLVRTARLENGVRDHLDELVQGQIVEHVGIASVVPQSTADIVNAAVTSCPRPALMVTADVRLPFEMAYETPDTLGADRIAAAAGARALFPTADPLITIDAGTAVTIEVVSAGRFLGGAIAPGPHLLHASLAGGTAQLPGLLPHLPAHPIGRSTEESIRVGVMLPFIDGLRGLLRRMLSELDGEPTIVACGGWGAVLASYIPEIHHTEPHLVLHGVRALVEANRGDAAGERMRDEG